MTDILLLLLLSAAATVVGLVMIWLMAWVFMLPVTLTVALVEWVIGRRRVARERERVLETLRRRAS